ncbi:hypothetical protein QLX08_000617 [Tetragonisca angustula]|uniref:Uncharacterized protein n=1 Tax=Tetragonisca angustula TaxID=166442 RepID=A0AAW1AMA9_9HYME
METTGANDNWPTYRKMMAMFGYTGYTVSLIIELSVQLGQLRASIQKPFPFSREQFRVECVSQHSVPWCPMAQINHT